MDHPNIDKKVHPPIVTLIFIAIAYTAKWSIPIPLVIPNSVRIIGFSLVVIGVTRSVQAHIRQAAHQAQSRNVELLADAGVTLAMLDLVKAQGPPWRRRRVRKWRRRNRLPCQ